MQFLCQNRLIGTGFQQLLCILLLIEARSLFLQLQFHDSVTLWLQTALELHATFFLLTQFLRELVELMTRIGQHALLLAAALQQRLQSCLCGLVIQAFQLEMTLLHAGKQLCCLFLRSRDAAL